MWIFGLDNPIRKFMIKLADNKWDYVVEKELEMSQSTRSQGEISTNEPTNWFENFIIFLILVSSIQLTLENPLLDPNGCRWSS